MLSFGFSAIMTRCLQYELGCITLRSISNFSLVRLIATMTLFRAPQAHIIMLILAALLTWQPILANAQNPPVGLAPVMVNVCNSDLTRSTIDQSLPDYRQFHSLFREMTGERSFDRLRQILGNSISANERLAAMVAFLDREGSDYAEAITKLTWFSVKYSLNPFSRSLDVRVKRTRTLVIGRGIPKNDQELMTFLLSLSEALALIPLEAQDWPRPWRNGLNTLKSPSRFVNDAMSQIKQGAERLERTYDQLRAIDPAFKSNLFEEAPHPIEYRSIFTALSLLAAPLALQAWTQSEVAPYWALATSTLFAYSIFYAPLHGKLVPLSKTIRTRLKVYWFTSNLVRAMLVGTTLYSGMFVYRMQHSSEADVKGTIEVIEDYFAGATGENFGPAGAIDLSGALAEQREDIADYQKQLAKDPKNIELQLQLAVHEDTLKGLLAKQKTRVNK